MKPVFFIFLLFLLWRLFLFIPLYEANRTIPIRKGYEYTQLQFYDTSAQDKKLASNYLLSPWANFDGVAYLGIAATGYQTSNARFFPLFPVAVHTFSFWLAPFAFTQFLIAFFLSNIFFVLSLFIFFLLLTLDYSKKIAITSILLLLVFPTSFFFGSVYTESLFLLLSLLSFYFARKKQWALASICGIFLGLTRLVGVVIFFALLVEFFYQEKKISIKSWPIFAIPLGLIGFMIYNFMLFHNPLYFLQAQGTLANGRSVSSIVLFPQTIYRYVKILLTVSSSNFAWWISLLELCSFLFGAIFLVIAWMKKVRLSYLVFALLCFLIPVSSGTFTGLPRYLLVLFPMFLALALVRNRFIFACYIIISLVLLFLLTMYFARAYYIA